MSVDYASRLSEYENKGKCGQPEVGLLGTSTSSLLFHFHTLLLFSQTFDSMEKLEEKVSLLHEMILAAQHVVVHTGAGVSTAAGTTRLSC